MTRTSSLRQPTEDLPVVTKRITPILTVFALQNEGAVTIVADATPRRAANDIILQLEAVIPLLYSKLRLSNADEKQEIQAEL